jgi:hypothetical protein
MRNAAIFELDTQRSLIHGLEEAVPKRPMHLHGCADDRIRLRFTPIRCLSVVHSTDSFPVHLCPSVDICGWTL